ncbi:MAG TPA: DUF4404 family protein [Thermoanaerobaculia bacterium]|nr:DUF4404 family protein [Thermoanaerobaculia bacterium]
MERDRLHETLLQLHRELGGAQTADPETRRLLAAVQEDIDRVTGPGENPPAEEIGDRIESLAARFEADHPALALALRQVMSTLSSMGI